MTIRKKQDSQKEDRADDLQAKTPEMGSGCAPGTRDRSRRLERGPDETDAMGGYQPTPEGSDAMGGYQPTPEGSDAMGGYQPTPPGADVMGEPWRRSVGRRRAVPEADTVPTSEEADQSIVARPDS